MAPFLVQPKHIITRKRVRDIIRFRGLLISADKHERKPTGKQRAKRKQKARKSKRTGEITYGNDGDGDGGDDLGVDDRLVGYSPSVQTDSLLCCC